MQFLQRPRRSVLPVFACLATLAATAWFMSCGEAPVDPLPPPPNRAPVGTAALPDQTVTIGQTATLDVSAHFSDPDGDPLTYAAETSDASVAGVTVSGSTVTVSGAGQGSATITVTARDPGGLSVSQSFGVTVPNRAPVVTDSLPGLALLKGDSATLDVSSHFSDPDGDALTYAAETSDAAVAGVTVSGTTVTVWGAGQGSATISVTARDPGGLSAVQSFVATVTLPEPATVEVWPDAATIAPGDTVTLRAEAYDQGGNVVSGAVFAWSSSDDAVARVDDTGLVRGRAAGSATVTAAYGGAAGTSEITVATGGAAGDRTALIALYEATDGPNWRNNEKWLTDAPLGEWYGVDTDANGRVVRLDLSGYFDFDLQQDVPHGLKGSLPDELGDLTALQGLSLRINHLTDEIPASLGNLARLQTLFLDQNDLVGPIPHELGNLSALASLSLAENNLTGAIPAALGNLAALRSLNLSYNYLQAEIPSGLGRLGALGTLHLAGNNLVGEIPAALGDLASLRSLWLDENDLTGAIPPGLGKLGRLVSLGLSRNRLAGGLPPELGNLARLEFLNLIGNRLTGAVPARLRDIHGLRVFDFAGNDGLCVPGTAAFVNWRGALDRAPGPLCNESDRAVLQSLHESAGGASWTDSGGWLDSDALETWHGVPPTRSDG